MRSKSAILALFVIWATGWWYGCGVFPPVDDPATGVSDFLGIDVSDFQGAQAIQVGQESLAWESTDEISLPQDLFTNISEEVDLVLSSNEVSVTVDQDASRSSPAELFLPRSLTVSFRVAPIGSDACKSDSEIGPFGAVAVGDAVQLDTELLPLSAAAGSIVSTGRFNLCARAQGDFVGAVALGKVTLEFGKLAPKEGRVELCHVPPGNPENRHTITVGESAVETHLDHGDFLGPCEPDEDDDSDGDEGDGDEGDAGDGGDGSDGGDGEPPDGDQDGVLDDTDGCPGTPVGEQPDAAGCSCSQRDTDNDGVNDCSDACPGTGNGITVDGTGCLPAPADSDNDGVPDDTDICPNTPEGQAPDATGCGCSQLDQDGDGVNDCDDFCPLTPDGSTVDIFGCPVAMADAGQDATLTEMGCVTLQGSVSGGTPPYTYTWSAPGWEGSSQQSTTVMVSETATYTLTVTDMSFPPTVVSDTVTVTIQPTENLQYTIIGLGSPSSNASFPAGINDAGQVVGYYFTDDLKKRAFLFDDGVITDLGTLGGTESQARDINNIGQVVGQARNVSGSWRAFVWDSVNQMQDLGTLGGASSSAYAINDLGQAVGSSETGSATHAFLYDNGAMGELGAINSVYSVAYGVNDLGQVAGMFLDDGGNPKAFLYDDGVLTDLGSPLLTGSRAWAINDSGLVVGQSWGLGSFQSFIHGCDTSVDLGAVEGFPRTYAWGINESGRVVGNMSNDQGIALNAFVLTGGRLYTLKDLLVPEHGWEYLTVAFAVNSSGQIAGHGRIDGQFRGFLVTPAP